MLMAECICKFTAVISLAIVLKYVIVGVTVVYMERIGSERFCSFRKKCQRGIDIIPALQII